MPLPLVGILVGGRGERMGGVAKGNLFYEGRSILERTLEACRAALSSVAAEASSIPPICLVGDSSAYSALDVLRVADEPRGVGPMGGLRALLLEASRRKLPAIALACDLPFLNAEILRRLITDPADSAALAPRQAGRWQPLFARYAPEWVLPKVDAALSRERKSLQVVFESLGDRALVFPVSPLEEASLIDWDRPSDVIRGCQKSAD